MPATTSLLRRIGDRFAMLEALRRREGVGAAATVLVKQLLWSARYRLGLMPRGPSAEASAAAPAPNDPALLSAPPRAGVLFTGYVEASLGLGEALRGMLKAAASSTLPFAIYPYRLSVETRLASPFFPERYDLENRYAVNVIEMSADQLPRLLEHFGSWRLERSYNILRAYWELPVAPAAWAPTLSAIDEIWAPNAFVADSFRAIYPGPITIMPPCVEVEAFDPMDRETFGLDPDSFYFIFTFDYFSYPARKNPLAVLAAFQAAFPDPAHKVGLIIKSTDAPGAAEDIKHAIKRAAERDPRIVVIDKTLSRPMLLALIQCSDAYVSLHRSEGFGLGMVEAMTLGKPVIGTDFSGSRDFLSSVTGFPVAARMVALRPTDYIFAAGQVWADPEHAAAVAAMRRVIDEPEEAARRAEAGRIFVATRYGRGAVGRLIEARARAIAAARGVAFPS